MRGLLRSSEAEELRLEHLVAVRLRDDGLLLELTRIRPASIATYLLNGEQLLHETRDTAAIYVPLALPLRGGKRLVARGTRRSTRPDPVLIAALRKAHAMLDWERGMPVMQAAPTSPYHGLILRLALLAPDIQCDIMREAQPAKFNLQALKASDIPLAWSHQREALGWHR